MTCVGIELVAQMTWSRGLGPSGGAGRSLQNQNDVGVDTPCTALMGAASGVGAVPGTYACCHGAVEELFRAHRFSQT